MKNIQIKKIEAQHNSITSCLRRQQEIRQELEQNDGAKSLIEVVNFEINRLSGMLEMIHWMMIQD